MWRHVKNHRVEGQVITGPAQFRQQVLAPLHRSQNLPSVIRAFFYALDIRYAL